MRYELRVILIIIIMNIDENLCGKWRLEYLLYQAFKLD